MVFVLVGSWQIPETERLLKKSFTTVHVGVVTVMSVVFQIPPSTPPTQTVLPVASAKSTHTALIRPEVTPLPGLVLPFDGPTTSVKEPLSVQVKAVAAFGVAVCWSFNC